METHLAAAMTYRFGEKLQFTVITMKGKNVQWMQGLCLKLQRKAPTRETETILKFATSFALESFRFYDEIDYEYEIFSILSSTLSWTNAILAGKRDSRRHSTTSFSENVVVVRTNHQMLKVLAFCNRERS